MSDQARDRSGPVADPAKIRPAPARSPAGGGASALAEAGNFAVQRLVNRAAGPPPRSTEKEREAELSASRLAAGLPSGFALALPLSDTGALEPALRPVLEGHFGRDLGEVRLHVGSDAAHSAHLQHALAFTVGHDIYFAGGQYRPDTPEGLRLLGHELAHVVQQSSSEPYLQRHDPPESEPARPAEHPLADYYYLYVALDSDVVEDLENTAIRREHLRAGRTYEGPAGSTSATAPLENFLPPAAAFVPRSEMLAQNMPRLVASIGSSSATGFFTREIARNEAARLYLEGFAGCQVTVELVDPEGRTNEPSRLRFSIEPGTSSPMSWTTAPSPLRAFSGRTVVRDMNGAIPLDSLDVASNESLAEVTERAGAAAEQLARVAQAQANTRNAVDRTLPLADEIVNEPERFALQEVAYLHRATLAYRRSLRELRTSLLPANSDQESVVQGLIDQSAPVEARVNAALQTVRDLHGRTVPELTAGEAYREHEEEQERLMSANWRAGGWGYGWMVLNGLEWTATEFFHGAGTLLTAGYMELEAGNASRYRAGQISYEAYSENIWWNFGKSLVVLAVTAMTAGIGGEFAVGALGLGEAATGTLAYATTYGLGEGVVSGFTSAVAADVYSLLASNVSSTPGVQQTQEAQIGGPASWIQSAGWGGVLGTGMSFGMFHMTSPGPIVFARETPLGTIESIEGQFTGGLPFEPRSVVAEPPWAEAVRKYALGTEPRISPLWETPGWRFGEMEYLEAGGFVPPRELFTEAGGQVVPIRAPARMATALPSGEIVLGPVETPRVELLGPSGQPLPRPGQIPQEVQIYGPSGEVVLATVADPNLPAVAGNPSLTTAGGNWTIRSATSGQRMLASQAMEEQVTATFGRLYGGGGKTRYPLAVPEQFSGRAAPQFTIETDFTSALRNVYGEAKVRDWLHPRFGEANAIDLAGSIQRMYRAAGIDAQLFPAASTAEFYVVSSRAIPAATQRTVAFEVVTWMRGQGVSPNAIYDFLGRLKFMEMRLR